MMPDAVSIQIDTRAFADTLKRYMEHTKKDLAEVVNTKAFFVCLKALRHTPAARASRIERELRHKIVLKDADENWVSSPSRARKSVSRINLIVNARRRRHGLPALVPGRGKLSSEMEAESLKIINARKASVGFAKAGWVWALKGLAHYVPTATQYAHDHGIRIGSTPLGASIPSPASMMPVATIINRAMPTRHRTASIARLKALQTEALTRALEEERASMVEYIERKLQARANEMMQNSR